MTNKNQHTGIVRDANGHVDKHAYQTDWENHPTRNPLNYLSLKKVNDTNSVGHLLKEIEINKSVFDTIQNDFKYCHAVVNVEKACAKYDDKIIKGLDDISYQLFLPQSFYDDVTSFEASENERIRCFSDDAKAELGIENKPWASDAYQQAYEDGHSGGYDEVLNHLSSAVEFAEKVEKSTNVVFYEKKAIYAYGLIDDVINSLPSGDRGKKDWLNPDTELNMLQYVSSLKPIVEKYRSENGLNLSVKPEKSTVVTVEPTKQTKKKSVLKHS